MEKIKIKEKNGKKVVLILFTSMLLILMILNIILNVLTEKAKTEEIDYEDMNSVQDVLSYYKCTFISEEFSDLKDFNKDIRLIFRYQLYDGEKSNEEFFNNLITDLAKELNYTNFRLIDEKNNIEIKVICKNRKIYQILINDIEEYFIYMDSKINLKKYTKIETTDLQIESVEIQNLINSNWENTVVLGTRESIFESYYQYFDEGIKTRTINGKIYNIVFTKKYGKNVVNGIFPGIDLTTVESKLGKPAFEEKGIIGYKSNQIYAFFTENEISIYRVGNFETDDFFKLADKLLDEEIELLDFMNQLTYLWPDYSEYKYDSDYAFISYPLKGIDIKIGYEDTNAIVLYNNVNAPLSKIERYLENPEFVANLQVDNVFEAEKRRVEIETSWIEKCNEYEESKTEDEKKITKESLKFGTCPEFDYNNNIMKMRFISKDGENPNRELNDTVYTYIWFNSEILIFSQKNVGIFYYNVINGQKNALSTGDEEYKLKSFENGVLKYDNSELIIQY